MNVHDITRAYLEREGYDGLYTEGCGCALKEGLMPCCADWGNDITQCQPGYRHVYQGEEGDPDNGTWVIHEQKTPLDEEEWSRLRAEW